MVTEISLNPRNSIKSSHVQSTPDPGDIHDNVCRLHSTSKNEAWLTLIYRCGHCTLLYFNPSGQSLLIYMNINEAKYPPDRCYDTIRDSQRWKLSWMLQ